MLSNRGTDVSSNHHGSHPIADHLGAHPNAHPVASHLVPQPNAHPYADHHAVWCSDPVADGIADHLGADTVADPVSDHLGALLDANASPERVADNVRRRQANPVLPWDR